MALARMLIMIEKSSGPEEVAEWVRNFTMLPTYDQPGKEKRSRISYHLVGNVVIVPNVQAEEEYAKHQLQMWEQDREQL